MVQFSKWIRKTVQQIMDPDKESRVQTLVALIQNGIHAQKKQFSLLKSLHGHHYTDADLSVAKERVYRAALERGWRDGQLNEAEQQFVSWLALRLELPTATANGISFEFAFTCFGVALAKAMEDGVLDQQEDQGLERIAASVGWTLPQFARTYFMREGESLLRAIFLACVADKIVSQSDWEYLLHITQRLGITHDEMLAAIHIQARQFVEHILADAVREATSSAIGPLCPACSDAQVLPKRLLDLQLARPMER